MAYNGNIIGPKNEPDYYQGNGIWNLNAATSWKKQGKWYFNANASASSTSVTEGDTFTVTVNTIGVEDGTYLFWTTNEISGAMSTADFTDLELNGYGQVVNNTLTITRKVKWTALTSGTRQFAIVFRTENIEGPIVASSPVITISDLVSGGASWTRGSYRIHRFASSEILYCSKAVAITAFLVGGGGGGGDTGGGGGGGGGVVNGWTGVLPAGSRWVIVGGGGGTNAPGGHSYIDGLVLAYGGGGGGNGYGAGPQSGGSGGGGSFHQGGAGPNGTGQGNGGGSGNNDGTSYQGVAYCYSAGGGGGGIGGGGGNGWRNGYSAVGGNGGPGGYFDPGLDGTAEPYAGGGGGARYYYGSNGAEGVGQGANRGGGGKGGGGRPGYYTPPYPGDAGVVYIRYLIPT